MHLLKSTLKFSRFWCKQDRWGKREGFEIENWTFQGSQLEQGCYQNIANKIHPELDLDVNIRQ